MPVQLFPDDSQLPDLGISGDSNLWHDGYSYWQESRKDYMCMYLSNYFVFFSKILVYLFLFICLYIFYLFFIYVTVTDYQL